MKQNIANNTFYSGSSKIVHIYNYDVEINGTTDFINTENSQTESFNITFIVSSSGKCYYPLNILEHGCKRDLMTVSNFISLRTRSSDSAPFLAS
ncbi:hypothetical protein TVAG_487010 [Trichomonas vaginalis G3]|uniref:Uncharacterized protein n=1 Tax=Trichomonas vaginalis (strain ATCC PRA-98 / G3) TaxID=412133 RepID=A2DZC9_TRIV3|nr:hypothetical protein TVAGG3_1017160 [Trichomonas vaginalis G3]EAY14258.1 hypothetical protein TVAG_487010 [Trichomonas vaginalis G3]KAI5491884.1 hypothetical protein TVAGG3_1017160 [Trichomonas vaginalis G3]|eukprot:XP_001326481.1 hypothetical protein [Trichomonas vaginalis G3]